MKNFNGPFCEKLLVSVTKKVRKKEKKKRSRSNDFGSDEYSYSILYSDPRISEYSDTRSSPNVVGTQKSRLNETVLLSTQNMLKLMGKKIFTI